MFTTSLVMTLALALAAPPKSEPVKDAVVENCEVASIQDQSVPGNDPGVLVKVLVKEGDRVKEGMEVGRVDDREAQANLIVKQREASVADQEANSEIGIVYQEETAKVAKLSYERLKAANENVTGTVTKIDIERAKLEWQKAVLGTQKEREKHISDGLTAQAKHAEVQAAEVLVERRILRAPFDGIVVSVAKHVGEWVTPGEPVIQLVRVDRLRIGGTLDATKWGPQDIDGRKVTVEVTLPRNQVVKVPGQIVYVSPVIHGGKEFPVWAEIDSPIEEGRFVVRAGSPAKMTIHVSEPAIARVEPAAAEERKPRTASETKKTGADQKAVEALKPVDTKKPAETKKSESKKAADAKKPAVPARAASLPEPRPVGTPRNAAAKK